jgi:GNAT superfamily N-acetyltransferase
MYWVAFGEKLRIALSPPDRAIEMLAESLDPDYAIIARSVDGQLLGVAGYKTPAGSFMAINFECLRRHFGIVGATWRGLVLSLLVRQPAAGTLLMDGIFVTERARGQGVGKLLLSGIKRKAKEQGCSQVRLDVIDTNPRAQQLYEREGFRAVAIRNLGPGRLRKPACRRYCDRDSLRTTWCVRRDGCRQVSRGSGTCRIGCVIPTPTDQNPSVQSRSPMDMMRHG